MIQVAAESSQQSMQDGQETGLLIAVPGVKNVKLAVNSFPAKIFP